MSTRPATSQDALPRNLLHPHRRYFLAPFCYSPQARSGASELLYMRNVGSKTRSESSSLPVGCNIDGHRMGAPAEKSWARFSGSLYRPEVQLADVRWFYVMEDVRVYSRVEGPFGLPFRRPDMPRSIWTDFSCPRRIILCILPRVVGVDAGYHALAAVQPMAVDQRIEKGYYINVHIRRSSFLPTHPSAFPCRHSSKRSVLISDAGKSWIIRELPTP